MAVLPVFKSPQLWEKMPCLNAKHKNDFHLEGQFVKNRLRNIFLRHKVKFLLENLKFPHFFFNKIKSNKGRLNKIVQILVNVLYITFFK